MTTLNNVRMFYALSFCTFIILVLFNLSNPRISTGFLSESTDTTENLPIGSSSLTLNTTNKWGRNEIQRRAKTRPQMQAFHSKRPIIARASFSSPSNSSLSVKETDYPRTNKRVPLARKSGSISARQVDGKSEKSRHQTIQNHLPKWNDTLKDSSVNVKAGVKVASPLITQHNQVSLKTKLVNKIELSNWKTDISSLVRTLTARIKDARIKKLQMKPMCTSNDTIANSCDGPRKCLRTELPADIKTRISQLIEPVKLRVTKDIRVVMNEMSRKVHGRFVDIIIITGASSNHFFESQAMIKNVHENVFPWLKNFTFLFYNLGLSDNERNEVAEHCRCQVLDFPFDKFPKFVRNLGCFSWKPVIIKAHLRQANVVIWADASIRFHAVPHHLSTLIEQARQRGIQLGAVYGVSPFRTLRSLFHYFGDEPCVYLNMTQGMGGVGFYARDPFVDRAILEPWVACAIRQECMCAARKDMSRIRSCNASMEMEKDWRAHKGPISYGLCHRFDQSAISLILHKLYQDFYPWVVIRDMIHLLDVQRGHRLDYFSTFHKIPKIGLKNNKF